MEIFVSFLLLVMLILVAFGIVNLIHRSQDEAAVRYVNDNWASISNWLNLKYLNFYTWEDTQGAYVDANTVTLYSVGDGDHCTRPRHLVPLLRAAMASASPEPTIKLQKACTEGKPKKSPATRVYKYTKVYKYTMSGYMQKTKDTITECTGFQFEPNETRVMNGEDLQLLAYSLTTPLHSTIRLLEAELATIRGNA